MSCVSDLLRSFTFLCAVIPAPIDGVFGSEVSATSGVVVEEVARESAAQKAGLQPGDVDAVLRAAGTTEVSKAEGLESPAAGERLVLAVPARLLTTGDYTLIVRGEGMRDSGEPDPSALAFPLRFVRTR